MTIIPYVKSTLYVTSIAKKDLIAEITVSSRSAVSTLLRWYFSSNLRGEREKFYLFKLISDKHHRLRSDAAHHARRLIGVYDIGYAKRSFFVRR